MFPIHKILHPTDFSERSWPAFELARSLARDYAAELLVLHVIAPTPQVAPDGVLIGPSEDADWARDRLEQFGAQDGTISIGHRLVDGYPAEEILNVARDLPADLVVLGTHGRGGLSRLLMGSVAEQVMRAAPCPVLTVRHPAPAGPPEVVAPELANA